MNPLSLEQVQDLLHDRLRGQVRDCRLVLRETKIVLQGIAASYYAKQVAQHLVFNRLGAVTLVNEIEVRRIVHQPDSD